MAQRLSFEDRFPQVTNTDALVEAFFLALDPPPDLTVSEWADQNRIMDSSSPRPGPWRTDFTPYMREIMDRASPKDPCQRIVIKGAAQSAKTEGIHCAMGFIIDHYPGPMLVVQSTVDLGRDWSKGRFQVMVDTTPALQKKFGRPDDGGKEKDGDNTIRYKKFPGGSLFVAGANAPSGLRSKPVRFLFLDEVDSYPDSAGKEGDPVTLAERRTSNFASRKIFMVSTPTIKGESRISVAYEQSDQRRYFVPCPHCGEPQILRWECVHWPEGKPSEAVYGCAINGCVIVESDKTEMLARGEWRATNPGGGDGRTHGYHISALYSPFKTWVECALEFVAAKPPGKPVNIEQLKTFINTVLGEEWDDTGGRVADPTSLFAGREKWWGGNEIVIPRKACILTAGCDTQDDRVEGYVLAWGPSKEVWLVDRWIVRGDPKTDKAVWDQVAVMLSQFYKHESGVYLNLTSACLDSGGHATDAVLAFCDQNKAKRWWAIKGFKNQGKPIWTGRALAGTKHNKRKTCMPVGTFTAKAWWYACLVSEEKRVHFPNTTGMDPDWCDSQVFVQLTTETLKKKFVHGEKISYWWKPDHMANEAWDCFVYSLGALEGALQQGYKLDVVPHGVKVVEKDAKVTAAPVEERLAPRSGWIPSTQGWLR